jgi:hypothetical protein
MTKIAPASSAPRRANVTIAPALWYRRIRTPTQIADVTRKVVSLT